MALKKTFGNHCFSRKRTRWRFISWSNEKESQNHGYFSKCWIFAKLNNRWTDE